MTDVDTAAGGDDFAASIDATIDGMADKFFDGDELRETPLEETKEQEEETPAETATEEEGATAEEDTAPKEEAGDDDQGDEPEEGAANEPLTPPDRWSADDKKAFEALPREAQDLVLKRERDVEGYLTQKTQELSESKREYEALDRLIAPRKEAWALDGFTTEQAMNHLFSLSDFAGKDPQGFIQWFAAQQGVDLENMQPGDQPDPQIKALRDEIAGLKQHLSQGEQAQQEQARTAVRSAVQSMSEDSEAYPYFSELSDEITMLIPTVRQANPGSSHAEVLSKAYEKAVWANDTTRQKELTRQEKAKSAERARAAKQAAAEARKANEVNIRGQATEVQDAPRSLDDIDKTLEEAYDKAVRG